MGEWETTTTAGAPSQAGVTVWPGRPDPLGATWDGAGTNFAVLSAPADRLELCLFDGEERERRCDLVRGEGGVWHGYLPGVAPGQRYGFRAHGLFAPARGQRFDPAKLLIDPYARAIEGPVRYELASTLAAAKGGVPAPDGLDDAAAIPRCVVVDAAFDWEGDRPLEIPWAQTVVYELHVKGFTMRHPGVREDLRGTYAGLASEAAIEHLRDLGVTAVELLPVHHVADEEFLHRVGLRNYWGYSTIGFFAPHALYAATGHAGEQVREFKGMVKALHRAGIEVILDVVYNHSAEGGPEGPSLAFRGLDDAGYYRHDPADPTRYADVTGTGNTLDVTNPDVLRLVLDSLRYWAGECHVDGFRFDLAPALCRDRDGFDPGAAFLDLVHQEPLLARAKLIAEPWDLGPGGYRLGAFPGRWREWNGRYRDGVRDFWRGRAGREAFAESFAGSPALLGPTGRPPTASINYVTCHDGFTLADLVSYERKHNDDNLQGGSDGSDDNRSWNCGVEGPTSDRAILALRARQRRNLLATLLLSQGVPMLLAGDELARSQRGNNNAWCQDNELSWLDWDLDGERREALRFVRRLVALRRGEPAFRGARHLLEPRSDRPLPGIWWFRPDGRKLAQADWGSESRTLGCFLNGEGGADPSLWGEADRGDSFLVLVNGDRDPVSFKLPPARFGGGWRVELTTADAGADPAIASAGALVELDGLTLTLLRREG